MERVRIGRAAQISGLALAVLGGVLAGRGGLELPGYVALVVGGCALVAWRRHSRLTFLLLLMALLSFGVWRGYATEFSRSYLGLSIDRQVVLVGVIGDDPGPDGYGNTVFNLSEVTLDGRAIVQPVKIKTLSSGFTRGFQVQVSGKLRPARGVVPAQISYAQVTVLSQELSWLERLRQRYFAAMRSYIPAPMNGFGLGLLVGARSLIPDDLQDDMSAVGLSHLVAASGYNLTVLVMATQRLFLRLSLFIAMAAGLWLIIGFIVISGFSAAVFRASVVSLTGMLVGYYGLRAHPFTLLALPAAITVGWNPDFLLRDLGWQLSFTAFYGVLVLAPQIEARWVKRPNMIKSLLIESSCAHMTTLPLIMWRFDNVSIIAPIANLFVLPTIPLAMLLSFATGLIGALAPWWLAAWVALPAIGLLGLCVAAAQWFAALPFAAAKLSLDGPLVAGFYLGIMVFSWVMWRRQRGFSQGLESSRISTLHM